MYAKEQWSHEHNKKNELINFEPGTFTSNQSAFISANMNKRENSKESNDIFMSIKTLEEYYPALAFHLIIKTIKNSINIKDRRSAITAFLIGMRRMDSSCLMYIELAVPPFLELVQNTSEDLRVDLLEALGNLASYLKQNVESYLISILEIIVQNINIDEKDYKIISVLISLIQSISISININVYPYFSQIILFLLKHLKIELNSTEKINNDSMEFTNIKKIMQIIRLLAEYLEAYTNLILSQLLEYLNMQNSNNSRLIKQEIMFTIFTFAKKLDVSNKYTSLFQGIARILEQNVSSLPEPHYLFTFNYECSNKADKSFSWLLFMGSIFQEIFMTNEPLNSLTDLNILTLETLHLLSRKMGNDFALFAPMFDRILLKNEKYSNIYEKLQTQVLENKLNNSQNKIKISSNYFNYFKIRYFLLGFLI